jgi:hypothetical protein
MICSSTATSYADLAIGPTVSYEELIGTTPLSPIRPKLCELYISILFFKCIMHSLLYLGFMAYKPY